MKYPRLIILLVVGMLAITLPAGAQTMEDEIKQVINTMFDGMRTGDSAMVAGAFLRTATMQTITKNQEGEVIIHTGSLQPFLNAVGSPHDKVWDERLSGMDIKVDGDLASVWAPYAFYLGDIFSHCGVNSFQMGRINGDWKIIYIVDTRRRTECKK